MLSEIPYKYEKPNNIIAEAIILKTKYFIAASLDKKLDLFKAMREYKLNEELYPPKVQCPSNFKKCPCLNYE